MPNINNCFPSVSREFWYIQGRVHLCEQSPVKTLGAESLKSAFLGRNVERVTIFFGCWRNEHVQGAPPGRGEHNPCARISPNSKSLFPFTVTILAVKMNICWSQKSPNIWVVLWKPETVSKMLSF